jgi:hypothetical protein
MGVRILTHVEQVFEFDLGEVTYREESGTAGFSTIKSATNPLKLREFAGVLEAVADLMEIRKNEA